MRVLLLLICLSFPTGAAAQIQDSIFRNYNSYAAFVDEMVKKRDFAELVRVLGGRDEYTEEEIAGFMRQFLNLYKADFPYSAVINVQELGSGFRKEMRVYWTDGLNYLYYYAFLHDRGDRLVVLEFNVNSDADVIFSKF